MLLLFRQGVIMLRRCLSTSSHRHSGILKNLSLFRESVAIVDAKKSHTYKDVQLNSSKVANAIRNTLKDSHNERICFVTPNNADYIFAQLGVWKAGHVALPLCKSHPVKMLDYYIQDSAVAMVITSLEFRDEVHQLAKSSGKEILVLEDVLAEDSNPNFEWTSENDNVSNSDAMILYTSGTTGPPKGVVLTHRNLDSQVGYMLDAWGWNRQDSLLHVLPLHHTHGAINCLLTPLSVGAKVVMLPEFDAGEVWRHLLLPRETDDIRRVNLFMAVPTIYAKLIEAHKRLFPTSEEKQRVRETLRENVRLMVSGSAALPQPILEEWREVSGHTLLERYGMTEVGMALTNPLKPESERRPGCVGRPFPGVEARIVGRGEDGHRTIFASATASEFNINDDSKEPVGDLEIRGPNVFREYFRKPKETAAEFTDDGWFKTGDTAAMDQKDGVFKILGRSSVDIIKSGGYKISALDIERILLGHPNINDVAVVGIEDPTWGQVVGAVVVLSAEGENLSLTKLQEWAKERMPPYHVPRRLVIMAELPRNNMGKVNKKELVKEAFH